MRKWKQTKHLHERSFGRQRRCQDLHCCNTHWFFAKHLENQEETIINIKFRGVFFASNIPNYSRPFPVQTPHPHLCASDSSGTLTCVMWLNLSVDPLVVSAAVLWGSVWTGRHTRVAYVLSLSFRINLLWVKGKGLCVRRGLLDASFA